MYVDPRGLWSITFGGYDGLGGTVSFGRDPDTCQGFMSAQAGVGLGVGASYDPLGGRPGGSQGQAGTGGVTFGTAASIGGGVGAFGLGVGGGVSGSRGKDFGTNSHYNNPSLTGTLGYEPGGKTGASVGGNVGFEFGIYDKGGCGCKK